MVNQMIKKKRNMFQREKTIVPTVMGKVTNSFAHSKTGVHTLNILRTKLISINTAIRLTIPFNLL